LDFLYGLAGSFASILWHHVSPWKDKPPPDDEAAPVA